MINELIELNNTLIEQNKNEQELKKQLLIKKMLEDKDCFQKISIETAFNILKDLQVPKNKLKEVYIKLQKEES